MEIAVGHHQPLFGATIQHPLMQGAVLYPGKGSAWQPVVTSLPPMAELPKESIIANTDFTTTSVLAKRRLSSKKRKKLENQQNRHSGCDSTLSDGSANSPSDSAYGSSPSVTSTTSTPHDQDRIHSELRHSLQAPTISTTSTSSYHKPLVHSSSSSFHPMVVHHPHAHAHSQPPNMLVSETSVLQNPGNCPPNPVGLMQNQFSNPVLSHLQQELNYRFLSSGAEQSHADQRPGLNQADTSSQDTMPTGVKWCNAHVSVARMIQQHQAQLKAHEAAGTQPQPLLSTVPSSDPMDTTNSSQHVQGGPSISQPEPAITMTSQQQQQLALLQLYGVHPTITSTAAGPSIQPAGGYLAMPYPNMHDVPLVQFAAVPQLDGTNSIAMIKPGMASEPVALALNPATAVQMGGPGVPATAVQMGGPGVQHVQPYAHGPIATAVDAGNGGLVYHGGAVSGSWMAPVPMIGGSCIVNPFNPGILATPWVK